jgi:hypothetical protein
MARLALPTDRVAVTASRTVAAGPVQVGHCPTISPSPS